MVVLRRLLIRCRKSFSGVFHMVFVFEIFAMCLIVAGVALVFAPAGLVVAGFGVLALTRAWVSADGRGV